MAVVFTIQGYFLPVCGLRALLGAEDRYLLLSLADEENAFGPVESGPILRRRHRPCVALLAKVNNGNLLLLDEASTAANEGVAHEFHERRGGDGLSTMEAEEADDAAVSLQRRLIDVEVHAVDAFDFESHVLLMTSATVRGTLMGGSGRHDPSGSTNRFAVQIGAASSIPRHRHDRSHLFTSRRSEAEPR